MSDEICFNLNHLKCENCKDILIKQAKQEMLKEIIDYGCEHDDYTYDEIIEYFINKYDKKHLEG